MRRSLRVVLALVFVFFSAGDTKLLAQTLQVVGSFEGYPIYMGTAPSEEPGEQEYYLLALPNGPGPHPVAGFARPYLGLPSSASTNQSDKDWEVKVAAGDLTEMDGLQCSTGPCLVPSTGMARLDLNFLADYSGVSTGSTTINATRALRNGYGVAIIFSRHYAGRGMEAVIDGVNSSFRTLMRVRGVDPNNVACFGRSQGAQLCVMAAAIPGRPLHFGAIVAEAGFSDYPAMIRWAFQVLPQSPGNLDFFTGFYHRFVKGFGANQTSRWNSVTRSSIADNLNSPYFGMASSEDMFVPVSETESLYQELLLRGKPAYKWVWDHGPAPTTTKVVSEVGHGAMDIGSAVRRDDLAWTFVCAVMPSPRGCVVRIPEDVDLVTWYYEVGGLLGITKQSVDLAGLRGSPNIWYESHDPRVPSGRGDLVNREMLRRLFGIQ